MAESSEEYNSDGEITEFIVDPVDREQVARLTSNNAGS